MNRILIIIAFYATITLSSCCAHRIAGNTEASRTDSSTVITKTEMIRDTVVRIAPDSAIVKALLECDSVGHIRMTRLLEYEAGERVKPPRIDITDNVLTASAHVDSMGIYMKLHDRLEQERTTITDSKQSETIIEVNRLTWWQTFWMRLGHILSATVILATGWKIFKLIKK